jgi:peptide chain release factor 1
VEDLSTLKKEYEELAAQLSSPEILSDTAKLQELSRRYSELGKLIAICEQQERIERPIAENEAIIEKGEDEELVHLAQNELEQLRAERERLSQQKTQLNNPSEPSINEAIIEIRAGVGGEESALFAQDLARMYMRYAERNSWKTDVLEESRSELKGLRDVTFEVKGSAVYDLLKHESGVHRVQRVPETEKSGRVHTSTASVAVLPKAKPIDIEIKQEDIKVETFRASGPGGQNVNKVSSAVRVTHVPTGMMVASQKGRSQAANRETALTILRSHLLQKKLDEEERERSAQRREQIGSAERSEKVRTYNFPQDRVTDHRVGKSWHGIAKILDGDLGEIAEALKAE